MVLPPMISVWLNLSTPNISITKASIKWQYGYRWVYLDNLYRFDQSMITIRITLTAMYKLESTHVISGGSNFMRNIPSHILHVMTNG